jgi:hypothetical protein
MPRDHIITEIPEVTEGEKEGEGYMPTAYVMLMVDWVLWSLT